MSHKTSGVQARHAIVPVSLSVERISRVNRTPVSGPDNATNATVSATSGEMPDTDDPVVLRELLRQAREQLALHRPFDEVIANNVARSEALLAEATKVRERSSAVDATALHRVVAEIRSSLVDARSGIDKLDALLSQAAHNDTETSPATKPPAIPATSEHPDSDAARTIEVVMHPVHAPALARSAQQFLMNTDGVTQADVRELAEGMLRITVASTAPITGETLAAWEPDRTRTVRTSNTDVLELELDT